MRGWASSLQDISGSWTKASSMAIRDSLLSLSTAITISHVDRNMPSIRLTLGVFDSIRGGRGVESGALRWRGGGGFEYAFEKVHCFRGPNL